MTAVSGYKLMRMRKDGTLGPLFINRSQRIRPGKWLWYQDYYTRGYAHRPGWHALLEPHAPHLKLRSDRVWCRVDLQYVSEWETPGAYGHVWLLAKRMRVVEILGGWQ